MDGAGTGQGAAAVRCLPGGTAELAGGSAGWAIGSAGGAAGEHGASGCLRGGDGGQRRRCRRRCCSALPRCWRCCSPPEAIPASGRSSGGNCRRTGCGRPEASRRTCWPPWEKWCKAQCILLGVTFCELLTGFLLLRQGYALLLAALIAVIDALPVFGTGTVLVPWGALCLLTGNVPKGLGLLALYGVISLVRSVLEPKIMAAQVDLPPLAALAAMYVGFCAFGVAGMVLWSHGAAVCQAAP